MSRLLRRWRRGVGAIEFALTLPFLLYVTLGIVELSLLMHRSYVVSRAARDACRTGALVIEGQNPTGDLIENAAVEEAAFALQAAGVPCGVGCTISATWSEREGWQMLEVGILVPYAPVTRLFPMLPHHSVGHFIMLTQQQMFH